MGVVPFERITPARSPYVETRDRQGALPWRCGHSAQDRACDLETGRLAMKYVIVMEQGEDGSWWVQVPSLPGCFSWGSTPEDAARNAREAIEGHIEALRAVGEEIPDGLDGNLLADI